MYLRQFVARFGGDLQRVMANRDLAVYRIKGILAGPVVYLDSPVPGSCPAQICYRTFVSSSRGTAHLTGRSRRPFHERWPQVPRNQGSGTHLRIRHSRCADEL